MYAVIELGGHQHRIEKDQVFLTELTGNEAGSEFVCDQVLALGSGSGLKVGKPTISGATVKLKVVELLRAPKLRGFKYKRRKHAHTAWGHRQSLQKLQVVEISG